MEKTIVDTKKDLINTISDLFVKLEDYSKSLESKSKKLNSIKDDKAEIIIQLIWKSFLAIITVYISLFFLLF